MFGLKIRNFLSLNQVLLLQKSSGVDFKYNDKFLKLLCKILGFGPIFKKLYLCTKHCISIKSIALVLVMTIVVFENLPKYT